jgi:hypothetical protein
MLVQILVFYRIQLALALQEVPGTIPGTSTTRVVLVLSGTSTDYWESGHSHSHTSLVWCWSQLDTWLDVA